MLLLWLSVNTNPIDPIIHYNHHYHPDYNMNILHTRLRTPESRWREEMALTNSIKSLKHSQIDPESYVYAASSFSG